MRCEPKASTASVTAPLFLSQFGMCPVFRNEQRPVWFSMWCTLCSKRVLHKVVQCVEKPRVYHSEWSPLGSPKAKTRGAAGPKGFWPRVFPKDYIHTLIPIKILPSGVTELHTPRQKFSLTILINDQPEFKSVGGLNLVFQLS